MHQCKFGENPTTCSKDRILKDGDLDNSVKVTKRLSTLHFAPKDKSITEVKGPDQGDLKTMCNSPHPKMYPYTKFGIPTSNKIGDMLPAIGLDKQKFSV